MMRARNGRTKNGTRRIAGSRNRFSRNGLDRLRPVGPAEIEQDDGDPAATLALVGHQLYVQASAATSSHQLGDVLGRGLRHDAVAEIEDERPPAHRQQDGPRLVPHRLAAGRPSAIGSRLPCSAVRFGTSHWPRAGIHRGVHADPVASRRSSRVIAQHHARPGAGSR